MSVLFYADDSIMCHSERVGSSKNRFKESARSDSHIVIFHDSTVSFLEHHAMNHPGRLRNDTTTQKHVCITPSIPDVFKLQNKVFGLLDLTNVPPKFI